jgi:hypothetical protein
MNEGIVNGSKYEHANKNYLGMMEVPFPGRINPAAATDLQSIVCSGASQIAKIQSLLSQHGNWHSGCKSNALIGRAKSLMPHKNGAE